MQNTIIPNNEKLEVIVKYHGLLNQISAELNAPIELLSDSYAIITLNNENQIVSLQNYPQIEYIEMPKNLTPSLNQSLRASCIDLVNSNSYYGLKGAGTIIAIIDSGIDYSHPDFINQDGSSRIISIWDQNIGSNPPRGFLHGTEYSNQQINDALRSPTPLQIVPHTDYNGHGTAVAGIAAGNGRVSQGEYTGVAPQASLIIVALGKSSIYFSSRSTDIMRAVKYIIDKAQELNMPVAINISYGSNNGSHDGQSLFEMYLEDMSYRWKASIVIASGNEGVSNHHFEGKMTQGEILDVGFTIVGGIREMYLTLWKNFADSFSYRLTGPNGQSSALFRLDHPIFRLSLAQTFIDVYYGFPTNYNVNQELYLHFKGQNNNYITTGAWRLDVRGDEVVDGIFNVWLPTIEEVSEKSSFLNPTLNGTVTIPGTAEGVITVGGYNSNTGAFADFSGRGLTSDGRIKPDIVAPAVNITSVSAGGGYNSYTGTSFAAPFVTGSCALMLEWGIVKANDPYLYGEKIKAYLRKGAEKSNNVSYPNTSLGYGKLCLKQTMDFLATYNTFKTSTL